MSYIVLARKYRPQNFNELKGQEVLVQTITNAFTHNRLHHAYLLTGIRGIGKTTTARIIAKTLNCSNLKIEGGILMPCEQCSNCVSANNGSHPDVLEFDAASHTGIDDIKQMLEGISYAPVMGKYRVFIVDEVHMLSTKAFNSLLKTLEEPPQNVVFVFATTELHKVPVTILSRCQKFSLLPLSQEQMISHLQLVAVKESIIIDDGALKAIANKSGGSVRDALSILDQSSTTSSGKISKEVVEKMLGILSESDIAQIYNAILSGVVEDIISSLARVKEQGIDEDTIIEQFLEYLHNQIKERVKNNQSYYNLLRLWNIFLPAVQDLSYSFNKYAILEVIFIKAVHVYSMPTVENLVHSISEGKIADILKNFPDAVVSKS